jgi:drug/metabolite transporter (DMT)-like permease
MSEKKVDTYSFAILLLLGIIWGGSFLLIKKGLIALSPFQVAAVRISVASAFFLPFFIGTLKKIPMKKWALFLLIGLTGSGIPAFLYPLAQTSIDSSVSGTLNSLTSIFTLVFATLIFGVKQGNRQILGVIIGFIGAALLFLPEGKINTEGIDWKALYIILATLFYAFNVNIVKKYIHDIKPLQLSAASFVMMAPFAWSLFIYTDVAGTIKAEPMGWYSFGAIVFLSVTSTCISTIIFYNLVKRTTAVFSSLVTYLIPIFALIFGSMDGEEIGISHLVGMAFILTGVFISSRK